MSGGEALVWPGLGQTRGAGHEAQQSEYSPPSVCSGFPLLRLFDPLQLVTMHQDRHAFAIKDNIDRCRRPNQTTAPLRVTRDRARLPS